MLSFYQNLNLLLGFAGAFYHEALQVPPLLPEYLNHPVQIVVQSSPDWQLWVGAGATLLGAAIGAGLGAWGAYKSSLKAGIGLQRRDKLEQSLTLIDDIGRSWGEVLAQINDCLRQDDMQAARDIVWENYASLDYKLCQELRLLARLYSNNAAADLASNIETNVYLAWSHLTDIKSGRYGTYPFSESSSFQGYISEFIRDLEQLKSMLISELSLIRR